MTFILAIDPGLTTGWAILADGVLVDVGLGDPRHLRTRPFSKVLIEKPQVYPGCSAKKSNDLITLAIMVGRYAEVHSDKPVEFILPHEWKGSIDADVCTRRIVTSLSNDERSLLKAKLPGLVSKDHNAIDAVGLAKWSLRRSRAGVF